MKVFPLEPLRRVRDLRLDAAQRVVAERRAELERAEHRRDLARQSRLTVVERRKRHQQACEVAMSEPGKLVADWMDRAERYRLWIDGEILKGDAAIRAAQVEVDKALAGLHEARAVVDALQAKVDALQTFRGDWVQAQQREATRREEQESEDLYRSPREAMR